MSGPFTGKRVLLGVTGSIAAYKAVDLASKLTQAGASVDVLMTWSATRFVTPLTFRSVTHRPVITDLFDADSPEAVEHVALAKEADALVVAPATAHMLAKLALGLADDPISVVALATAAPLVVAPAMDANMWSAPAVQRNAQTLAERGALIEPGHEEGAAAGPQERRRHPVHAEPVSVRLNDSGDRRRGRRGAQLPPVRGHRVEVDPQPSRRRQGFRSAARHPGVFHSRRTA